MQYTQLITRPVPVWFAKVRDAQTGHRPSVDVVDLVQLDRDLVACQFRAVGVDRLGQVVTTGIDVEPTDAVIYADLFDKAWEYGGMPKVVLALRQEGLK